MTLEQITQHRKSIYSLLTGSRIYEAIVELKPVVEEVADYDLIRQFNDTKVSYDYLLQYFVAGTKDDGREDMLRHITESLYTIADKCVVALSAGQTYDMFYTKASVLRNQSVEMLVLQYLEQQNKHQLLCSVEPEAQNEKAISELARNMEKIAVNLFNKIWCTFPLSNEDAECCKRIFESAPEYLKQLIVAAMFLGETKFYDETKLAFMIDTYITSADAKTQTRALSSVVMTMLLHPHRIRISTRIQSRFGQLVDIPHFYSDVNSILQRLVMARNTENLSKRMREELMPNIMNIDPGLMSKIKNNPSFDPSELEENPQWQDWLEDSGVGKKIEELNRLQTAGEDVFISTFSKLKAFPFFNTMANWFLPFYPTHTMCDDALGNNKKLVSVVNIAPFLCDSDKYSFCFSIASMPSAQLNAMVNQLDLHNRDLKELEKTELPDDAKHLRDAAINAYIQSLYRFFTLFSRRNDFQSVFHTAMDFTKEPLFRMLRIDQSALLLIAEYYLKNHFYKEALSYYLFAQNHFSDVSARVIQKIGFAYQSMGEFQQALDYYLRYELVDDAEVWNIRHIATCYRALHKHDKALECYEKLLRVKESNASLCLNAGHCLLELNRIDEALHYYFKADYLDSNPKVWRALAWTLFLNQKYEQSEHYYQKLMDTKSATPADYLNYGHLLLSLGKIDQAVNEYALSVKSGNREMDTFVQAFNADVYKYVLRADHHHMAHLVMDAVVKKINNS